MGKSLRVLIVEDSEDDALLVIRELERGGYDTTFERVETAEAMTAALEKQAWDIILSDYHLPHFSAPEALGLFQQSGLGLPFIVISGTVGEETAVETMKAGARDYLMKGNLTRLVSTIERELGEAEVRKERKQIEETLRLQAEIIANISEGIYLIRASDGVIAYTNPKFDEIFGYNPGEIVGKHVSTVNAPTEKSPEETANEIIKAIKEAGGWQGEIQSIKKDGTLFWCYASVATFNHPVYGEVWIVIHTDITERKRVEHALIERVKEIQCLHSIDMFGANPKLTVDEVCQEVLNILPQAWQYPEVTGVRLTLYDKKFETKNYRDTEWKQSSDVKLHGVKAGEVRIVYLEEKPKLDEGPFLKEERQLINSVAEQLARIIEGKQAQKSLIDSEVKYRSLTESLEDLIYRADPITFEVTYVNNSIERFYGYTVEEWLKDTTLWNSSIYPEDKEGVLAEFTDAQRKVKSKVVQYRIIGRDKEIRWVEDHISWEKDQRGNVVSLNGVMRDITERKKMEEQLLVNDRLASIGELVSGVAHELNNPLTSVIGFSDLLAGRKDLPDDVKEDLKLINREAHRTANIVKNLLTFARKHPKEKQPTDVNNPIEAVLELRAYEQKVSNIHVNIQLTPDLPEIMANSFDLQQVFLNIIVNAEHAMLEAHGKGTITITTERDGAIVRVSLADDGPGIPEENLGHIFDPFFTTKEVGKGTGLGLSICYGTITEHGGKMYAESELGKGAIFIIELPVATTDNEGTSNENS